MLGMLGAYGLTIYLSHQTQVNAWGSREQLCSLLPANESWFGQ